MEKYGLILVHGVGSKSRGDLLRQFLGDRAGPLKLEEADEYKFPVAKIQSKKTGELIDVYELYWGDLRTRSDGILRIPFFALKVLLGFGQIGAVGWRDSDSPAGRKLFFGQILHHLLFGLLVSLPVLFFTWMHYFCLTGAQLLIGLAVAIMPIILLTLYLIRFDRIIRWNLFLIPTFAALAWISAARGWVDLKASAHITALSANGIQTGAVCLISLAIAQLVWREFQFWHKEHECNIVPMLVRILTLGLPFALLAGGVGSILWALNLGLYKLLSLPESQQDNLQAWVNVFHSSFPYDLALMEFVFATATAVFGLFTTLGLILFFLALSITKRLKKQLPLGLWLRNWLVASLLFFLLALVMVSGFYILNCYFFRGSEIYSAFPWLDSIVTGAFCFMPFADSCSYSSAAQLDTFAIYTVSSLRLLGFLPSFLPKINLGAQIGSDVLFWLIRERPLTIASECSRRLKHLIDHLNLNNLERIIVIGYSQGSVISVSTLADLDLPADKQRPFLITAGSPINSLYKRFLGITFTKKFKDKTHWYNYFRSSDFVGGYIPSISDSNKCITDNYGDHHFNYFSESTLLARLDELLAISTSPSEDKRF